MYSTILLFALVSTSYTEALQCGSCRNVTHPDVCNVTKTCNSGDRCFTKTYGIGSNIKFDLGCRTENECLGPDPSLIGRSLGDCDQCCAVNFCNIKLCSRGAPLTSETGVCADDPNYNCEQFSSVFNICADTVHAKTVCRKWCGLCGLVDGAWSLWSPWTPCDVTCGTGQLSRSRTCTDPPPAHGGLDCSGNSTEHKLCTQSPCPIHGGWSNWHSWSTCSHTCSIGTQIRNRSCDSPTPQLAGNHCFGEPVDFQACFLKSCADGGWSSWSQWSNCTRGLKTRTRSCDNPAPSRFGRDCDGNNEEALGCTSHVAFTVTTPSRTLTEGRPIFTNTVTNVGGGYNPNTAKFTCPVAGLYLFTFNVQSSGQYRVHCWIHKNGQGILYAQTTPDNNYDTSTATTYLQLTNGDVVNLGGCDNWNHVYNAVTTSFSGALVGS